MRLLAVLGKRTANGAGGGCRTQPSLRIGGMLWLPLAATAQLGGGFLIAGAVALSLLNR